MNHKEHARIREDLKSKGVEARVAALADAQKFIACKSIEPLKSPFGPSKFEIINDIARFVVSATLTGDLKWVQSVVRGLGEQKKPVAGGSGEDLVVLGLGSGWLSVLSVLQTKESPPLKRAFLLELAKTFPAEIWRQDTVKATIKTKVWDVAEWLNETHPKAFGTWHLSKKNMANALHFERLKEWRDNNPEAVGFLSAVTMRWNQLGHPDIVAWTQTHYKPTEKDWLWLNEGWALADPLSSASQRAAWRSGFEYRALAERHLKATSHTSVSSTPAL